MATISAVRLLLGGIVRVLLPPLCPLCRQSLPSSSLLLCLTCSQNLRELKEPFCTRCGLPYAGVGPSHPCPRCRDGAVPFDELRAWGLYCGTLLEAIHAFKYREDRSVLRLLESLILQGFDRYWVPGAFSAVVPVPSHPTTLHRRGFDLPSLLARTISHARGFPWRPRALCKARITPDLVGLGHRERELAVQGAFSPKQSIEGHVLLVDDVATSTATARACAKACRDAGATRVTVLVLARTPLEAR